VWTWKTSKYSKDILIYLIVMKIIKVLKLCSPFCIHTACIYTHARTRTHVEIIDIYIIVCMYYIFRHFLIVEWNTVSLYNYQGRLLGIPKWRKYTQEPLYTPCISLCADTLVIRDQNNEKCKMSCSSSSYSDIRSM
jgi:hypothetical protein